MSVGLLGWHFIVHVCFCPSVSEPVIFRTILCKQSSRHYKSIVLVNEINVFVIGDPSSPLRVPRFTLSLCFHAHPLPAFCCSLPALAFCSCSLFNVSELKYRNKQRGTVRVSSWPLPNPILFLPSPELVFWSLCIFLWSFLFLYCIVHLSTSIYKSFIWNSETFQ